MACQTEAGSTAAVSQQAINENGQQSRNRTGLLRSRTNRSEACVGVISVGVDAGGATIRLGRVLGLIGHLASIHIATALLVLLGKGKVGPSSASPAINDQ